MSAEPSPAASRLRVLVVDDNLDCAHVTVMLLRHLGHEGRPAYDAASALATAADFRPQLMLLDLAMPGKDGYALARDLRAIAGLSAVPIVALTGYIDDRHREAAVWARFDAYLVKPCSIDDLRQVLRTVQDSEPPHVPV